MTKRNIDFNFRKKYNIDITLKDTKDMNNKLNTVVDTFTDEYGTEHLHISDDNLVVSSCISSLARNNTFCPNIVKIKKSIVKVAKRDEKGAKIKDENGKKIYVTQPQMEVSFSDGTWTTVKLHSEDTEDDMVALIYALAKRMFGTYTPTGYVTGDGFMNKIKKLIDGAVSDESEAAEIQAKKDKKEAEDKKAHEEAVERKTKNPSIGLRLRNLEDKFNKLIDTLTNK